MTDLNAAAIDGSSVEDFESAFGEDRQFRAAMNAVTVHSVRDVALNRAIVSSMDHTFSVSVHAHTTTDQKKTGRCWMFAGLNLLRSACNEALECTDFELSPVYSMFWDKLEKSNYFLEGIITTADRPLSDRLVCFLLDNPIHDAGQWNMFPNIVQKYGVVPNEVMQATESSDNSREVMNPLLARKLREMAARLRQAHANGTNLEGLRDQKAGMLKVIYRILAIHLGQPPSSFHWQWYDKAGGFHRRGRITPVEFFQEYAQIDLESLICLINAPSEDKEYGKLYTVEYLGNVIEGECVKYLNTDIEVLEQAAIDMLRKGTPVWFGCECRNMMARKLGIWDENIYEYELVYGERFEFTKGERLMYGESEVTHAMVLTGVDLDQDGKPRKWKVQNSWGKDIGNKGYFIMSSQWFRDNVFEIVADRSLVPPAIAAISEMDPVPLPPWDPMGALAWRAEKQEHGEVVCNHLPV